MHKIFTAACCLLLTPNISWARWANTDDATSTVVSKVSFDVEKNGAYTVIVEREVEIRKEKAREEEGLYRITYTPSMESFELLKAETRNGKKVIEVGGKEIEKKPLASVGSGFDAKWQVTVAYPDVGIGSKLYIKFKKRVRKPPYPGAFFVTLQAGWQENNLAMRFDFSSAVPIFHEIFDKEKFFEVQATANKVSFILQKPLFKMAMEEENPILAAEAQVWIGVTTLKDWSSFPQATIADYESILASQLPEKFESVRKEAEQKATMIEQVNAVTSSLANAVRYVGDWRAVRGTYIPRKLSVVAASGYGDCKDFSATAGAILRKMGYETHVAWIARGANWIAPPLSLAAPEINHAILYVKKNGKELWVDPTNNVSFAQGVFTDIADRKAMVLHPDGAFIKKTPTLQATDGAWTTKASIDLRKDDTVEVSGRTTFSGRTALNLTGSDLFNSKASTDYALISWQSNASNLLSWKVGPHSLTSRIVDRIETDFEYHEKLRPVNSTAGAGYMFPDFPWLYFFKFKRANRVSDLNLMPPLRVQRNYQLTGRQMVLPKEIQCEGKSTWADYSRHIRRDGAALAVDEFIDFKMKVIPAKEIASKEFEEFQEGLIRCMQEVLMVFK